VTPSPLSQLALTWLACRPEGAAPLSDLRRAMARTAPTEDVGAAVDALAAASLITVERRRATLTGEGRAAAAGFLGVAEIPRGLRWAKVQRELLPAKVLGEPRALDADQLRAAILRRQHRIAGSSLSRVADALGWKLLGIDSEQPFSRAAVLRALIGRELGVSSSDLDKTLGKLAARSVGSDDAKPDALRAALLRSWLAPSAAPAPDDLPGFARRVLEAARTSPTGRFGDNKVFISHVHRRLGDAALDAFKRRLVEAHRAGLLALSRADLVEAMDPSDVAESETRWDQTTFHFIRLEEGQR